VQNSAFSSPAGLYRPFLGRSSQMVKCITCKSQLCSAAYTAPIDAFRVTVFSNIAMASLILAPGLSPMYRNLVTLPNLVLTSVMACRVYRHTRLVLTQEPHGISCSNALGNIGDTHSKAQSPDCVCPARQRGDDPCDKAATVMHLERSQKEVTDRYSTNEGLV
jgi:hypothetical protein